MPSLASICGHRSDRQKEEKQLIGFVWTRNQWEIWAHIVYYFCRTQPSPIVAQDIALDTGSGFDMEWHEANWAAIVWIDLNWSMSISFDDCTRLLKIEVHLFGPTALSTGLTAQAWQPALIIIWLSMIWLTAPVVGTSRPHRACNHMPFLSRFADQPSV